MTFGAVCVMQLNFMWKLISSTINTLTSLDVFEMTWCSWSCRIGLTSPAESDHKQVRLVFCTSTCVNYLYQVFVAPEGLCSAYKKKKTRSGKWLTELIVLHWAQRFDVEECVTDMWFCCIHPFVLSISSTSLLNIKTVQLLMLWKGYSCFFEEFFCVYIVDNSIHNCDACFGGRKGTKCTSSIV